ncbi:hypothetical protein K469DRAFT_783362 [Zopfia rhizophila CBS 207.26]|uniref:NACHT domain-containing protein n=1 Tax=Zopfia rhizophila CBS 207.26 TaxID=1314779 RepID=A0A6A6ETJ3_9PEZI|nr:hypothetical protein K469DRAFT_783362 [Zopfia rhizophila CBS 207.26]
MMALSTVPQESINDLWALAAAQLSDDDKRNINFSRSDRLNILADLHAEAERFKQRSIESRWKYARKSGETVIIRDVFDKIVRWIDIFKQVGDVAVQYDPAHASLPWAGIRFILQIAVNDTNKLSLVVEGLAWIAELICRYAVIEALYLQGASKAAKSLERAVVKLYANILGYLSKAKQYLKQGTAKRIIKSAVLAETQLDSGLNDIRTAGDDVGRCMDLVDRNASRRADIIRWLSPEPYIQHHKQVTQGVLAGTGQWLLSDPVFKKWKDESASSILWLHGIPGSGKSKLVSIVIEDALKSFKAGDSPQPVFFYCSRNPAEPARSDPRAVLASLARQLSCLAPGKPLLKPTVDLFKKEEAENFASGSLQVEESCELIMQLIEQYPLTKIIIDAMDECDPWKRRELLKALEQILRDSSNLVKVFISSRNDQDIVLRLQHYPSLEIDSRRNGDDIARFVKDQAEQLIQNKELLKYSTSLAEMKRLVVNRVIEGAAGMFRWASMQLQYLCSLTLDADVKNSLGRLPPDLYTLYDEIYGILSAKPGELRAIVFNNVLCWLLCAQRTLSTREFLAAVSLDPQTGDSMKSISKDLVLEICNNFVVFDSELDTFRLAHLSVREFLEQQPKYKSEVRNALAAEVCLWTILSTDPNSTAKNLLVRLNWYENSTLPDFYELHEYSDIHWAKHCESAADERRLVRLQTAFRYFISGHGEATSSIGKWVVRLKSYLQDWGYFREHFQWKLREQLEDAVVTEDVATAAGLFVSCAFGFEEVIEQTVGEQMDKMTWRNRQGRSPLQVAARNGNCAALRRLFNQSRADIPITEAVVEAAASSWRNGKEVMGLLLDRRGTDTPITETVVEAAVSNWDNGKEVMRLLLDRCGPDILITEAVVKRAAENRDDGTMMKLLLDRLGADMPITEAVVAAFAEHVDQGVMRRLLKEHEADICITQAVVKAAAKNVRNGKEVMELLLDRRGADILITEAVVEVAISNWGNGKEVMKLLLDRCGPEIPVTEAVVERAAGNRDDGAIMRLLLDRRGADILITEAIVAAVAEHVDQEMMRRLLDRREADISITQATVIAAARNWKNGKEVMMLLLDRYGAHILITEAVVEAAASPWGSGKEIMTLLLDRRGADMPITEAIVITIAKHFDQEVMTLLLDRRGADIPITDAVVVAAASNWENGKEVMTLLLDRHGAEISVTEEVLEAAAANYSNGEEVMTLLLWRELPHL